MRRAVVVLLTILATSGTAHAQDWEATMQATTYLQTYIQIDTTNPPGDVRDAVTFLTAILRREQIDYQLSLRIHGEDCLPARPGQRPR